MVELVLIGRVGRRHGLDGSLFVEQSSHDPKRFAKGATLVVGGDDAQIVASKRSRGRPVIRLDRDVERGDELSVRRTDLPPPAEGSFYDFQLVGLAVEEEGGRKLGIVRAVTAGVANDVVELDAGVMLPLHEACVLDVDLDAGRILVARGFADAG